MKRTHENMSLKYFEKPKPEVLCLFFRFFDARQSSDFLGETEVYRAEERRSLPVNWSGRPAEGQRRVYHKSEQKLKLSVCSGWTSVRSGRRRGEFKVPPRKSVVPVRWGGTCRWNSHVYGSWVTCLGLKPKVFVSRTEPEIHDLFWRSDLLFLVKLS